MRIEERDYSFLRGTECKMETSFGSIINCIVPNVEYSVGISFVMLDNPDIEMCCLNADPEYCEKNNYKGTFASMVRKMQKDDVIKHGFFDKVYFKNKKYSVSIGASVKCAYK